MNIDTALRRREALEEMDGDETMHLAYDLLDEVARLRAALTVPKDSEPWLQPLQPDDTRFGFVPNSWVLNVPDVLLVVSTKEATDLADWFISVGCDVGVYLYEEMEMEP